MSEEVERIVALEIHLVELTNRLDRIEASLQMLIERHQRDEVGRDMVYTIGKWTVWIVMAVTSVFHFDKLTTLFSHTPLTK